MGVSVTVPDSLAVIVSDVLSALNEKSPEVGGFTVSVSVTVTLSLAVRFCESVAVIVTV